MARAAAAPAHAIALRPPKEEMERRVRGRTGHPGGVQGESGARFVARSLASFAPPAYDEGFGLISAATTPPAALLLAALYRGLAQPPPPAAPLPLEAAPPAGGGGGASLRPRRSPADGRRSGVPLPSGGVLPAVALGTMELKGEALASMLSQGFPAVDTAPTYKNETAVGQGLSPAAYLIAKVPRAATGDGQGSSGVRDALRRSLQRLGRRKADLVLLHWPDKACEDGSLAAVWAALEEAREAGEAGEIGVCNATAAVLRELLKRCRVRPAVNQVERHPLLPQWELLDYCAAEGVAVQAHTPLGAPGGMGKAHRSRLLDHPTVARVASEAAMAPAQVLLGWSLRHGVAVAPKCSSAPHAADCLAAARRASDLTPAHMRALDEMSGQGRPLRVVNPSFMRCIPESRQAHHF